jgi:hypothetical protein
MERRGLVEIPVAAPTLAVEPMRHAVLACRVCGKPRGESICASCRSLIQCEVMEHKWHAPPP